MKKIPTLFLRDPDDMSRVLRDYHPACRWVRDGEGVATRKYDGTCVMLDAAEKWWARREVKPDKHPPAGFRLVERDAATGKRVGWEPIEQSSFAKYHAEALETGSIVNFETFGEPGDAGSFGTRMVSSITPGTYELIGPKVNGNPEGARDHALVRHGYMSALDYQVAIEMPRDFDGLRDWLRDVDFEGIVWHHPDGRMAKIKGRDFGHRRTHR